MEGVISNTLKTYSIIMAAYKSSRKQISWHAQQNSKAESLSWKKKNCYFNTLRTGDADLRF